MKLFLRNIKIVLVVFLVMSFLLMGGLFVQQYRSVNQLTSTVGESKIAVRSRYRNAGKILSSDLVTLASSYDGDRHYAEDPELAKAVLHIVGDYTHNISDTVENNYQTTLLGRDRFILKQLLYDISGRGREGDDLILTIDSELSKKAYELLGDSKGAIVVLNYFTGELLASVSTPSTAPENVINYEDIPETALFNRAFSAEYAPGSTFKVITTAAWLNSANYNPDLEVECLYPEPLFYPDGVKENYGSGHGLVNLQSGFETSCNYFFGEVGVKLGSKDLKAEAERFGYNQKININKLAVNSSQFEMPTNNEALLSWMAIGQPQGDNILTTSPLHMAMVTAAIANNGIMVKPQLIKAKTDIAGNTKDELTYEDYGQVISADTATKLQDIMETNVANNYDSSYYSGIPVGMKSGTAEVSGQESNNRLAVAYMDSSEYPYAVCVVLEDSEEAATDLVGPLLERAIELK